jgi:hypothetical protein
VIRPSTKYSELPARARLRHGKLQFALAQHPPDRFFQPLVADGVQVDAQPLAYAALQLVEPRLKVGVRRAAHRQASLDAGKRRAKGKPRFPRLDHVRQQLVELAFGEPERAEDARREAVPRRLRGKPGDHRLIDHQPCFPRHAGKADDVARRAAALDGADEAGRRSDGVRYHRAAFGKERLLAVVGRHLASHRAEALLDRLERRVVQAQLAARQPRHAGGGQVVRGRPEPARRDRHLRVLQRALEHANDRLLVVRRRKGADRLDADRAQPLRQKRRVGIDRQPSNDLVADRKYDSPHE